MNSARARRAAARLELLVGQPSFPLLAIPTRGHQSTSVPVRSGRVPRSSAPPISRLSSEAIASLRRETRREHMPHYQVLIQINAWRDMTYYGASMLVVHGDRPLSSAESGKGAKDEVTCCHRDSVARHCWRGQCWRHCHQAESL